MQNPPERDIEDPRCELTFAAVMDTKSSMLTWAKHNSCLSGKAKWIIFDRSDDADDGAETETITEDEIGDNERYECALSLAQSSCNTYYKIDPETSVAECYNRALEILDTPFVSFTYGDVIYEETIVDEFYRVRDKYPDEPLIAADYRQIRDNTVFDEKKEARDRINKLETSRDLRIFLCSYFIEAKLIRGLKFEDICEEETPTAFLLQLFKRHQRIVFLDGLYLYYPKRINRASDEFYGCNNKNYYIDSLKKIYLPLLRSYEPGLLPLWMKKAVYYQLYFKYYANLNLRNKYLLNEEETDEFLELSRELLQYIDDDIIMDNVHESQYDPPFALRNLFLELKYDCDESRMERNFYIDDGKLYFRQCGCDFDLSRHQNLKVMAFNILNEKLCVDMWYFTHLLHEYKSDAIYAELNGERYDPTPTDIYALDKVFGKSIKKSYTFKFEFPMKSVIAKSFSTEVLVEFFLELGGARLRMPLTFYRTPSKLNDYCHRAYWRLDSGNIITYNDEKLRITASDEKSLRKIERLYVKEAVAYAKEAVRDKEKRKQYIKDLKKIRGAYYRKKKKFANRRIWLFFDKLYKAGDNGEYAFRYANGVDNDIECYYVINEDAPTYPALSREFGEKILTFGSDKCKLYALFAETVVATHPDIMEFFGYDSLETKLMRDLFNPYLVCIAHGVTIQKNAEYQNRLYDNTMFYTTSSKYEVKHILQPIYGYSPDEVALTGMARFDGLKDNDQKQILITPTWRRNIVGEAERNTVHDYSEKFKETAYYRIYNRLINDPVLIDTARKYGYRIIFLVHPAMSSQIDDYERNDYVDIIPASGDMNYEKILTESSLMVTDYSGIHYDFGYMRKPVIYYQPKEVPMRFEEGGMKFRTMGFGPVCTEYEDAVKLICDSIKNHCIMSREYRERADDFFEYSDFNNSQRIYEAIKTWVDQKKDRNQPI